MQSEMDLLASEPAGKAVHLNRYYHFTELMRDPEIECELKRYPFEFDGSLQSLLVLHPREKRIEKHFIFFHGMDGDAGDGVVVREIVKAYRAEVICPGGRGPSWVSDAFLADAEQIIRRQVSRSKKFYLMGISMGGTQALVLPACLPASLQARLKGVIAFVPGTDLLEIKKSSAHSRVRETLAASVDGDESKLQERSPSNLGDRYPPRLPFAVFYQTEDSLMLTSRTETFLSDLKARKHPVASFSAPGGHIFVPSRFDYKKIIDALGKDVAGTYRAE